MKIGKIILSAGAMVATALTVLSFTPKSDNGTLYTFSSNAYHAVACSRTHNESQGNCLNVTYYTSSGGTNLGKITPFAVTE
jgi:hypothetical protein